MKDPIADLVTQALQRLQAVGDLDDAALPAVRIERTRDAQHGDFASNIAMVLAKRAGCKPRDLAGKIVANLPDSDQLTRVDIAGPGFINFYLNSAAATSVVATVLQQQENYGLSRIGQDRRVLIEFVSANPTGPLHVGHGRGAAYGEALASLLEAAGFQVEREYYVNDAGRQMDILAMSVWLRYLELSGEDVAFPANAYQGDYVWDIAADLHRRHADAFRHPAADVFAQLPEEPEALLDALIAQARTRLGDAAYRQVFDAGLKTILGNIRDDLGEFGVRYDTWFSERSLTDSGQVDQAVTELRDAGHIYEKDGALWFRTEALGDEKDRVVVRDNGQPTYFATDIAYHRDKYRRGYDRIINIWGADHHGYVARTRAAIQALGQDPARLEVLLVQFAVLYRGAEKVQMSTRSGNFVTLRELRREVGNDAARFFYVMRKCEQHLDFDLELAKSRSNENPVYYIQYAHARICSVMAQLRDKGYSHDIENGNAGLGLLVEQHEQDLMTLLARYPEVVEAAAGSHEPHSIAHYLRDLANGLHSYYNAHAFIVDDDELRNARLNLVLATRVVLANGLRLLGVSAPESM